MRDFAQEGPACGFQRYMAGQLLLLGDYDADSEGAACLISA